MKRRKFLITGASGTLAAASSTFGASGEAAPVHPTPAEIEGPFYPRIARKDKDFDLTQIEGKKGSAKGRHIFISGQVLDTDGEPVEDASVDLWQANAAGRYRHPHDPNTAPLDENFQGWAIVPSGKDGGFRFKTVFPGTYPASRDWTRPPHIHFKVSNRGFVELITQMYFPGEAFDHSGKMAFHCPVSIARDVAKRPVGRLEVKVRVENPNYTFNPDILSATAAREGITEKFIIQPGPNNPVGTVWLGLNRPSYGIHGTPAPEKVGRTESSGCFRLANWNAETLLAATQVGTPVFVVP